MRHTKVPSSNNDNNTSNTLKNNNKSPNRQTKKQKKITHEAQYRIQRQFVSLGDFGEERSWWDYREQLITGCVMTCGSQSFDFKTHILRVFWLPEQYVIVNVFISNVVWHIILSLFFRVSPPTPNVIRAGVAHLFYWWMHFFFPFKDSIGKLPLLLITQVLKIQFSFKLSVAIVITLHLHNHLAQFCSQFLCSKLINRKDFKSTQQKQTPFNATPIFQFPQTQGL